MTVSIYRHFRRALRAYQLYPHSSPVRLEAASSLFAAFQGGIASSPDGISFLFLEDGVSIDGQQVEAFGAEDAASGTGAGGDLFHLGVRELRFLDGLNSDELDRLLDPLARALQGLLNPVDEDLSVLLWEADLPHVWYLLYEEHAEAEDERAEEAEAATGPVLGEYLDADVSGAETDPAFWIRRLTDEERRRVVAAYRREWDREVPAKHLCLLLEILRVESRTDECAVIRRTLENQLDAEAGGGRFAVLLEVSGQVMPEAASTAGATRALGEVASWFVSRAFLTALLEVAPARPEDEAAVASLLAAMPAAILPESLAICLEQPDRMTAAATSALLTRFEGDGELQSICLRDSRASLRRQALLRIRPDGDDLRRVREVLRDRDPDTRVAALAALSRAAHPPVAALGDALYDGDPRVRIAAAEAVQRCGGKAALEALLRVMASSGFEEREPRERRAVYVAAGRLAPREVWPILARMAERRRGTWFGRRSAADDPAVEAIAQLGDAVVRSARERWRRRPELLGLLHRSLPERGSSSPGPAQEEREAA